MKHLILMSAILAFSLTLNAQKAKLQERVKSNSDYVAEKMNMNEENHTFLYETLLNHAEKTRAKKQGLSKQERKAVNKEAKIALRKALGEKFSNDEVNQILSLLKEKRKADRANNPNKPKKGKGKASK